MARFTTVDLLTERYNFQSPYCYAANNPIKYKDILGMGPGDEEEAPGGDYVGFIQNARAYDYRVTPVSAFFVDVSAFVLNNLTPAGAIDNAIATYNDPKATAGEKANATVSAAISCIIIKGQGKVPLTEKLPLTEKIPLVEKSAPLFQPADLPNSATVVRGGLNKTTNFENGTGVTIGQDGKLSGVSVNSQQGATVETLSKNIKNSKIGVTTVGEIRAAGGSITPSPSTNSSTHATIDFLNSKTLEELFNPVISNPSK